MSQLPPTSALEIIYPDSDGKPMADNTEQFRWIVTIQQNLDWLFADDPQVFVDGDLLWYPVKGSREISIAPDVLVAFGRPKGRRGSYKQWEENDIAPQVVFEVLSPSNTRAEMNRKLLFYHTYGVTEYYLYNPDNNELNGWLRVGEFLDVIESMANWSSPQLGIRFDLSGEELQIYRPDQQRFLSYIEIAQQLERVEQQAEQERQRADQERQRADEERQRAERLAARLRQMGIDPDTL